MSKFVNFDSAVSLEKAKTFSLNSKNRVCNPCHFEKIKREMIDSLNVMPPITVNVVTNNIIDGQHRHKAFVKLREEGILPENSTLKVMYVEISAEDELKAIVKANNNSKGWTLDDFVASYIVSGIVSYVKLDKWCKEHALSSENGKSKIRYGSAILTGRRASNDLKNGTFTFTDEEMQRAENVHSEMQEIIEVFGMKGRGVWIESLAVSWIAVREQHNFRTWMKEFKSKKSMFLRMPKDNSKDWDNIFAQAHLGIDKKKVNEK